MKIALCSSDVPFVNGGARNIVDWLEKVLLKEGHQVEKVYLPEVDAPALLFQQMMAFRWIDLQAADRIICFRPQSHLIPHPHKILWFIHHIRLFYDLWDTDYRRFPDDLKHRGIRDALHLVDTAALHEAKQIFTNSKVVSDRLKAYNNVDSEVLYPPVFNPERFHSAGQNDEIVCICRLEHHKRQHLLIDALSLTKSPVRLQISGTGAGEQYPDELRTRIKAKGLGNRITLNARWITDTEKVDQLAHCLAAAYLPLDEDSYGYPSAEASHSSKPVLTTTDSGGVRELVQDGINGYVTEPSAEALADAMDQLYWDRVKTASMGRRARERLQDMNISWSHVIERLLG
jgi:glycosyltransferase involved in cell wall biosynthesis